MSAPFDFEVNNVGTNILLAEKDARIAELSALCRAAEDRSSRLIVAQNQGVLEWEELVRTQEARIAKLEGAIRDCDSDDVHPHILEALE